MAQRCIACGGPAHEATGWVLNPQRGTLLCGRCAKEFARWYRGRMARMSHSRGGAEPFSVAASKSTRGEESSMFEHKAKACKFANVGGHYHAGGGALGQYRISKVKGQRGYRVHWTGGAVRKGGSTWVPTLAEGKKLVAHQLGCQWPAGGKRYTVVKTDHHWDPCWGVFDTETKKFVTKDALRKHCTATAREMNRK